MHVWKADEYLSHISIGVAFIGLGDVRLVFGVHMYLSMDTYACIYL